MSQYVIVVETGYKYASSNHRIDYTEPMSENDAMARFDALRAGTDDLLKAVNGATIADMSSTQFLRVRKKLSSGTVMDRVTVGQAAVQKA